MKSEIAPSWHPGNAPIAVFEDGREVFEVRREDDPLAIAANKWLNITRRIRDGLYYASDTVSRDRQANWEQLDEVAP